MPTSTQQFVPRPQFVNCFNRHPCCELWVEQGECRTNQNYMNQYCPAACHTCNPSFNITNECTNRHISCIQWQRDGQCQGNSELFMHENCRESCGFCNIRKRDRCTRARTPAPQQVVRNPTPQQIARNPQQAARNLPPRRRNGNGRRRLNTRMQARKVPKPADQPFRNRHVAAKKA
uniref:ShKT domain-containing protein n=1 Tax=Acrobeloides nanus TaxID=290746 RepID=A0A914EM91_9BILA